MMIMILACFLFLAFALSQELWSVSKVNNLLRFYGMLLVWLSAASAAFYQGAVHPGIASYFMAAGEANKTVIFLLSGLLMLAIGLMIPQFLAPGINLVGLLALILSFLFMAGGFAYLQANLWAVTVWFDAQALTAMFTLLIIVALLLNQLKMKALGGPRVSLICFLKPLGGAMLAIGMITAMLEQTTLTIFQPWSLPEMREGAGVLPAVLLLVLYGYYRKKKCFK